MNVVPYNEDFEKALIVGILSDTSLLPRIASIVDEGDFFKQAHKEIFKIIQDLGPDNADSLTVQDKLSDKTKEVFSEIVRDSDSLLPSLTNILFYAETIRDKSKLRAGIELGREIASICYEPNVSATFAFQKLEDMFAAFLQRRVIDDVTESTQKAFLDFYDHLGERIEEEGIQTGFSDLDMLIHRLEGLIILAARPSLGKTALALNIARNVAEENEVLFFSLEQSRESLFERMLATESGVSTEDIRTGAYLSDDDEISKIETAASVLAPILNRIYIDDKAAVDSSYITSISRQKKFEKGNIGLIVVDYLHIMALNTNQNKVDGLGDAVKELRALGKELNCPVLLLSQLNRQPETQFAEEGGRRKRRPELTDLRASGEIEQSADVVMFLYKESYNDLTTPMEDIVEVLVRKNRNGRIGIAQLGWIPRYVRFYNL